MVEIKTRIFGEITVEEQKIITFEKGILGYPELKKFTLIFDEEKGIDTPIKWLQSLDEPQFAMPVMNPCLVKADYAPAFSEDILKTLGDRIEEQETLVLVTVTVPGDVKKTTVNLRAPIVVNAETLKAAQLISDDETLSIKYAIYDAGKHAE